MLGDEGAANHNRLGGHYGEPGMQLFVYGREEGNDTRPSRYPARQTREASEAVARLNQVNPQQVIFAQQNPDVIDEGVFHNDVIAVSNRQVLFCHQQAFSPVTVTGKPACAGQWFYGDRSSGNSGFRV